MKFTDSPPYPHVGGTSPRSPSCLCSSRRHAWWRAHELNGQIWGMTAGPAPPPDAECPGPGRKESIRPAPQSTVTTTRPVSCPLGTAVHSGTRPSGEGTQTWGAASPVGTWSDNQESRPEQPTPRGSRGTAGSTVAQGAPRCLPGSERISDFHPDACAVRFCGVSAGPRVTFLSISVTVRPRVLEGGCVLVGFADSIGPQGRAPDPGGPVSQRTGLLEGTGRAPAPSVSADSCQP